MATTLGDKIYRLRKEKGMTLEDLAKKIDSSKGYVWELENRETKNPSAEKLRDIANALSVTPEFLLNKKKKNPDNSDTREAFFRKFDNLEEEDQKRILHIIETWGS